MSAPATPADASPTGFRDHALVAWTACGAVLPCLSPNSGPLVLVLSLVAPVLLADRWACLRNLARIGPVMAVHVAIVLYLCLNVLMAPVVDNAGGAILTIALAGLAFHVCAAAFPTVPARDVRLMARGLVIGCVLVAVFLAIEYGSRMSLQRTVQHAAEAAGLGFVRIDVGTWEHPSYIYMSRNLVLLIMLVWAAMALARAAAGAAMARVLVPGLLALVTWAALASPSATAKAGVIGGALAWLLMWQAPRLTAIVATSGWMATSLLCIPIAQLIHRHRLYEVEWINTSLRHRMMIWSASSEWFWQHPVLGLGIGGARKVNLNAGLHLSAPGIEGEPLNWHAHNVFVQVWFETGAVGGVLLCLFGLVLLRVIFRLPPTPRCAAIATFVSIFVIGLTGFSIWAAWYLAGFGIAALCILVTVFLFRDEVPLRPGAGG